MTSNAEWRELKTEFKELQKEDPDLRAEWYAIDRRWVLRGKRKKRFKSLAERAAIYGGQQLRGEEGLNWWLDQLKSYLLEDEPEMVGVQNAVFWPGHSVLQKGESVTIFEVSQQSGDYCGEWATQALKESGKRLKPGPGLGSHGTSCPGPL